MENNFATTISNEELALLPVCGFGGRIVVVDTAAAAEVACRELLSCPAIGFDTETRPTFRPGALNKVALLQLSTPDTCYLFRLCKMALERSVQKVLESKTTLKVGADVKNDLRALKDLRHFDPDGFVDLQGLVARWGVADKSVRKMAGIIMGVRVSKAQRLSNWEAATLTPAQQMYAATDAWICERMYDKLMRTAENPLPVIEKPVGDAAPKKSKNPRRPRKTGDAAADSRAADSPATDRSARSRRRRPRPERRPEKSE